MQQHPGTTLSFRSRLLRCLDMAASAKFSLSCMLDAALGCALAVTDLSMVYGGPVYVCAGLTLILGVSCLYLTAVFLPVYASRGWPIAAAHLALGALLLGNILFNYILCITTSPGNTSKAVKEGYHLAAGTNVRFCKTCRRAKPSLTHHCHICNLCVLRMDHHCPWMHNCIGFYNHRYFVLFVFYLCLGGVYAAVSMWKRLVGPYPFMQPKVGQAMILAFAISASAAFALGVLFLWHCYLVLTAQSTIDFLNNWKEKRLLAKEGEKWHNPHDHGMVANWKETFDAQGRFWWITWLLPSWRRKQGNPVQFLGSQHSPAHNGLPVSTSFRSDDFDAMV